MKKFTKKLDLAQRQRSYTAENNKNENAPANQNNNKIKKPITAYQRFCNARRKSLIEESGVKNQKQIIQMMGWEWSRMPIERKQAYIDEHKKEMDAWKITSTFTSGSGSSVKEPFANTDKSSSSDSSDGSSDDSSNDDEEIQLHQSSSNDEGDDDNDEEEQEEDEEASQEVDMHPARKIQRKK